MPFNIFKDFPENVRKEFKRRSIDYGINLSSNIEDFRGGRSPWIRIASGVVTKSPEDGYDDSNTDRPSNLIRSNGLVLEPNLKNYKNYYGMGDDRQFIARDIFGKEIKRLNSRRQPGPIVENITVESKGDMGLTRTASVTIKAFTQEQFDVITDFFCIAGTTLVLEWGWHTFFTTQNDIGSLLDLTDTDFIRAIASGQSFSKLLSNNVEGQRKAGEITAERSNELFRNLLVGNYTPVDFSIPDMHKYLTPSLHQLYDSLRRKTIHAPYMTPYEGLMELGNNDYDLYIGTVISYDISIDDGVYVITVNMNSRGESFLNMTNNESGLKTFFKNSQDSGFRQFLRENKDSDPRIFIKDEVDKTTAIVNQSSGVRKAEPIRDYDYDQEERTRIAELADVFFNVSPLYYGVRSTSEYIKNGRTDFARIYETIDKTKNLRNAWGSVFSDEIVKYLYVTDKNLIEIFNTKGKLVVEWWNVLPQLDGVFVRDDFEEIRKFLLHCYTVATQINNTSQNRSIVSILSNVSTIASTAVPLRSRGLGIATAVQAYWRGGQTPKYVFDGLGLSERGQESPTGINELWNTPNLLNVIRYYLEGFGFTGSPEPIPADGLSQSEIDIIESASLDFNMNAIRNDMNADVGKIRRYLFLGPGVTLDQVKSGIKRYILSAINPFSPKSSAEPLDSHIPSSFSGEAITNSRWGENDVSYILSALRIQQNTFSGTPMIEVDSFGDWPTFGNNAAITNDEDEIRPEASYSFITYGLLEELINVEILGDQLVSPILNSRETKLWFHKNMISSDKYTCILPNSDAPIYNIKNVNEKISDDSPRVNLSINGINERTYPGLNFSLREPIDNDPEGEMLLYSIFVNVELIERIFSSTADLYDAIIEILGYVNGSLGRRYEFKLERVFDSVQVIDFTNPNGHVYRGEYVFPYNTNASFIKNLDISLNLPNQIAIQALLPASTTESTTSNLFTKSIIVDDLYRSEKPKPKQNKDDNVKETPVPVSYAQCFHEFEYNANGTFSVGNHTGNNLVNYVYPHQQTIDLNTEMSDDSDTFPLPDSEISITIDGISGIQFFNVFNVVFVPRRFRQIGRFFVKGLSHIISDAGWDTTIDSQYMIVPKKYWNVDNTLDGVIILDELPTPIGIQTDGGATIPTKFSN